ncbi:MAG TPA: tetratricopeptide repeat protein, partial [Thermoanaerobaculia bacterium]|nr:tetratricopeptide repeat protein [Thermoanaerobaculia bacterium]
ARLAEARARWNEALALARQGSRKSLQSTLLNNLAAVALMTGDLAAAKRLDDESLALAQETGNRSGEGYALHVAAQVDLARGDVPAAKKRFADTVALREKLGEEPGAAESRNGLAEIALEEGNADEAARLAAATLPVFVKEKDLGNEATARMLGARALLAKGDTAGAAAEAGRAAERAEGSHNVATILAAAIESARVTAAGDPKAAISRLKELEARARSASLVGLEFEARLVRAQAALAAHDAGARSLFQALAKDASAKGFGLVAKKASVK